MLTALLLATTIHYRVHSGDSLSRIAARHHTTWQLIYADNRKVIGGNPNLIRPGMRLTIHPGDHRRPRVTVSPTPSSPAPVTSPSSIAPVTAAPGSYQACVIQRESGGNPQAVNPASGAGGLYGFLPSTWASLGYSGLPENAPVWEQTQAFDQLYAQAGTSPWASDGC